MAAVDDVLQKLQALARPDQIEGMAKFGMASGGRLGIAVPELRGLAKSLGRDHVLALALWESGILEARIVAGMIDDPAQVTDEQMERWVAGLNSWDVCDQLCMNLFERTALVWQKIIDWSEREEEFVKRASYTLIACLAWHAKTVEDARFAELLPVIARGATDERNFVKKAVNWALRSIGKRNRTLNAAAIRSAEEIQRIDSKAARWIAADALRELRSEAVQEKLKG